MKSPPADAAPGGGWPNWLFGGACRFCLPSFPCRAPFSVKDGARPFACPYTKTAYPLFLCGTTYYNVFTEKKPAFFKNFYKSWKIITTIHLPSGKEGKRAGNFIVNALKNRYSLIFKHAALPLVQKRLPPLLNCVHYTPSGLTIPPGSCTMFSQISKGGHCLEAHLPLLFCLIFC